MSFPNIRIYFHHRLTPSSIFFLSTCHICYSIPMFSSHTLKQPTFQLIRAFSTISKNSVLVFCGPSGVGKTTLIKKLTDSYPGRFGFSISHTTREKRIHETDGVDYYFTSKEIMLEHIKQNQFLEYEMVHGHYYGTSIKSVMDVILQNKVCLLDIDVQGVRDLMKKQVEARWIWLQPPSIAELSRRLHKRNTESEDIIQTRLNNSLHEIDLAKSLPFTHIIQYTDVASAYNQLCDDIRDLLV